MMIERAARCFRPAFLPVVVLALWVASSPALHGQDAEFRAAREKIEALLKQAERLQDEGKTDKAELLVKEAQELKQQLARGRIDRKERESKESRDELEEILQGLKSGAAALRALGRVEEAERLGKIAAELQNKAASEVERREAKTEREVALEQLKTMHIAMRGLLDAGREDSARLLQRAIRAQEIALEGRRDREAQEIREAAPSLGQRVELLTFAADKLREAGEAEQAQAVANFGEQLRKRFRAQQARERDSVHTEHSPEARVAAEQIETMNSALVALREGERQEAVELLKRAIQARQVRLRRLRGAEAEMVLEREPTLSGTVEVLRLASELWSEFGNEKNATVVGRLAEKLWSRRERAETRPRESREADETLRQMKRLEDELAELEAVVEKTRARANELRRQLNQ